MTPSVVGWDEGWKVGEDAVRLSLRGAEEVWWDLKRRVGTSFSAVVEGTPHRAEELLVPLLTALREDAEAYLGTFVSSCVLAVPACFSLLQRELMARAARAAGMEARVVAEPTAATLAFGREGRFLVFDFGAGTVDISVVESEGGVWQVLESVGSPETGGYDFDLALAACLKERLLLSELEESDPRWRTLVAEAERVKIALSGVASYEWTPPPLGPRPSNPLMVEREEMERLMRFFIRRLAHVVRRLWERYEPDHLLLVGGSSRIPLLKEILEREVALPERLSLCAEEAIAVGAALYASGGQERLLLDALSGDIEALWGDEVEKIVASGSPLPFEAWKEFEAKEVGRVSLRLQQTSGELRGEPSPLSAVELELRAGERVTLFCRLDASGRLSAELRREDGARSSLPLSAGAAGESDKKEDPAVVNERRLRELKLALVPLEVCLDEEQRGRLYRLIRQAEGVCFDARSVEIVEGLVKDLESLV